MKAGLTPETKMKKQNNHKHFDPTLEKWGMMARHTDHAQPQIEVIEYGPRSVTAIFQNVLLRYPFSPMGDEGYVLQPRFCYLELKGGFGWVVC